MVAFSVVEQSEESVRRWIWRELAGLDSRLQGENNFFGRLVILAKRRSEMKTEGHTACHTLSRITHTVLEVSLSCSGPTEEDDGVEFWERYKI